MALTKEQIEGLVDSVEKHKDFIKHNQTIFDILEGDLLTFLAEALRKQFSGDSSTIALQRAVPINVLKRIIMKLSKLYVISPTRETEKPSDQELIDYYVNEQNIDTIFNDANENFNSYKNTTIELFEDEKVRKLRARSIPSNGFLPFSVDEIDPTRPTGVIKFLLNENNENKFWIYTDEEFISVDEKKNIIVSDMAENKGVNPYGVLPFAYTSKSRYLLIPKPDTDILQMTLNIPVLLTDLAFSSMFLSNPILYTIDANVDNLKLSPNMYWNITSNEDDKNPQVGVVKPEPDLDSQLNMIKDMLALWLQTKNIKAAGVGDASTDSVSSGIALMIQEMDTTEDRQMQTKYFKVLEQDFWKRLASMHNTLVDANRINKKEKFSDPETLKVNVTYAPMQVIETRADVVKRLDEEVIAGFTTAKRAIRELYPDMDKKEIDVLIEEIEQERASKIPSMLPGVVEEVVETENE